MTELDSAPKPPVAASVPVIQRWTDGPSWDRFVAAACDSTLAHRWAWRDVVAGTYGHHVINLAAVRGPRLIGVLPLTLVRSRLFGGGLVSMPYLDSGGLCSNGDPTAERPLMAAASELADRHHAPLELRHQFPKEVGLAASLEKVTLTLSIGGGEDDAWSRIRSNRRSQIRKAGRCGLTASVHGIDAVGAFYRVWSRNMRDLGSPVHPRSFFDRILTVFSDDAWVVLVEDGRHPVGAGIVIRHQDRVVLPWSSSLRSSLSKGPNQLLYWEAIRHAIRIGSTTFDFGRSSRGAGTFDAKREWGAEPVQLYWHGAAVEDDRSRLDRLAWATRMWQRLPVPVTVAVGSRVRGGITR
jgi:FemAB-related protein (PEP-CTERM system-associated)